MCWLVEGRELGNWHGKASAEVVMVTREDLDLGDAVNVNASRLDGELAVTHDNPA